MSLHELIEYAVSFMQQNPLIALVAAVIILFLLYRHPKPMLSLILLALFIGSVYYVIMNMSSIAKEEKLRLIHNSEEKLRQIRKSEESSGVKQK